MQVDGEGAGRHMMSNTHDADTLRQNIQMAKDAFLGGLKEGRLLDIAFIGNASTIYVWEPGRIIDVDICIFVQEKNLAVGSWLYDLRQRLTSEFATRDIQFDLRLVKGAYKDAVRIVQQPHLVVHIALFTEDSYLECSKLMRWGWRKYLCITEPHRLGRLAPVRPSAQDVLDSVEKRLADILDGCAHFTETVLPDLRQVQWTAKRGDPLFAEHCLSGALVCARIHARILGALEPDSLNNSDFVAWYNQTVMLSPELRTIVDLKVNARNEGYSEATMVAPALFSDYLHRLRRQLESDIRQ